MATANAPHSNQAEDALLGAIMIDPDAMLRVAPLGIAPADFYLPRSQVVYDAMLRISKAGRSVDYVTLQNQLSQMRTRRGDTGMEFIGGPSELTKLVTAAPTTAHVLDYAREVMAHAFRRRLIDACGRIVGMAYGHEGTREELQQAASELFAQTVQVADEDSHLYGTDNALLDYLAYQEQRRLNYETNPDYMVTTPWPRVNGMLSDVDRGMLQIIAARPGVGKTIYMENVAEHNAKRGKAVAFYHLELSHQVMLDRRMARYSGHDYSDLRRGYSGEDIHRATDAIRIWQERMTYIHCPGWSAERIMADAARLHAEGKCDLAVLDYLQKMPMSESRTRNESSMIGQQVGCIKNAAERLAIPVLLGCQVTRDFKQRGKKDRPRLTDLYGSGLIEAYSNQVVILHAPPANVPEDSPAEPRELHIDKNTTGQTGMIKMAHVRGRFSLSEMAE